MSFGHFGHISGVTKGENEESQNLPGFIQPRVLLIKTTLVYRNNLEINRENKVILKTTTYMIGAEIKVQATMPDAIISVSKSYLEA